MLEGRWVAVPPAGLEEQDDFDEWVEECCPADRVALLPVDREALEHWWEWVPFEPDQAPIVDGLTVSWVPRMVPRVSNASEVPITSEGMIHDKGADAPIPKRQQP